jgi:eukaryotic-like serine/threonine-protein kinase
MKPLAPDTMIQNRYLVVHLIAKGGMGDVYLAVDQRLGSAVALKRTFFSDDEMLGGAFEREAKTLAKLRHPALPKVSDHFLENGDQYLVMEHIAGDDLSKRLEDSGKPFPVSWVMFWADQLLDALNYLHSYEPPIIHRDIKPQNLKLTDDNHIVLLDFGLSKESGKTQFSRPGSSGSVVGYTPHFASMEQIRGTGTGPRSDIYSLSATLYQLVTNKMPADALTRADALLNNRMDPIVPPSHLNPEVSGAVSNVLLKGLEISSEKRFASANEMQRALRTAHSQASGAVSVETKVESGRTGAAPLESDDIRPITISRMDTQAPSGASLADSDALRKKLEEMAPPATSSAPHESLDSQLISKIPTRVATASAGASADSGKKSGSWLPMVLGGIGGILLLAAATVGGAWYLYSNPASVNADISAASPTPAVLSSPTAEQAPSPSATVSTVDPNPTETTASSTGPTDPAESSGPQRQSNPADPKPVVRPKPPVAKATPKSKPQNDRTILLQ